MELFGVWFQYPRLKTLFITKTICQIKRTHFPWLRAQYRRELLEEYCEDLGRKVNNAPGVNPHQNYAFVHTPPPPQRNNLAWAYDQIEN